MKIETQFQCFSFRYHNWKSNIILAVCVSYGLKKTSLDIEKTYLKLYTFPLLYVNHTDTTTPNYTPHSFPALKRPQNLDMLLKLSCRWRNCVILHRDKPNIQISSVRLGSAQCQMLRDMPKFAILRYLFTCCTHHPILRNTRNI